MDREKLFNIYEARLSLIDACEYPKSCIQQVCSEAGVIPEDAQGNDCDNEDICALTNEEATSLESDLRLGDLSKRDAAVVILFNTGLRISDVAALKLSCIDLDKGTISLVQQKNGVVLSLPMSPTAKKYIHDYCTMERPDTGSEYIFLTEEPPYAPLSYPGLARIINRVFEKAGSKRRFGAYGNAHILRKRFVMNLLKKETSLSAFSSHIGHEGQPCLKYLRADWEELS